MFDETADLADRDIEAEEPRDEIREGAKWKRETGTGEAFTEGNEDGLKSRGEETEMTDFSKARRKNMH